MDEKINIANKTIQTLNAKTKTTTELHEILLAKITKLDEEIDRTKNITTEAEKENIQLKLLLEQTKAKLTEAQEACTYAIELKTQISDLQATASAQADTIQQGHSYSQQIRNELDDLKNQATLSKKHTLP